MKNSTALSSRVLATLNSADFSDCVNSGYRWKLYSDGHLSAEYVTRWQGSRTGTRYVTAAGYIDVSAIVKSDEDSDAEARLTEAVRDLEPHEDRSFRQTRVGSLIR